MGLWSLGWSWAHHPKREGDDQKLGVQRPEPGTISLDVKEPLAGDGQLCGV